MTAEEREAATETLGYYRLLASFLFGLQLGGRVELR